MRLSYSLQESPNNSRGIKSRDQFLPHIRQRFIWWNRDICVNKLTREKFLFFGVPSFFFAGSLSSLASTMFSFFSIQICTLCLFLLPSSQISTFLTSIWILKLSFILFFCFAQHIFSCCCLMDVKLGTSLLFTVTYCSRIHEYNSSDSSDSVSYSSRLASYWAASLEFKQLLCNCFIKLIDSEHDRGICKIFWRVRPQMNRQCKHIRCANFISLLMFRFAWKVPFNEIRCQQGKNFHNAEIKSWQI